jgi:hypothetical protein
MKTRLLILTSLIAVALVAVAIRQQREVRSLKLQLAQSQADLFSQSEARADQETKAKALERGQTAVKEQLFQAAAVMANLRNQTNSKASRSEPGTAGDSNSESGFSGGKDMSDMLARMMKNPAMKEMLRSQQKVMVNSMYGPLFKDLSLSDERKAQLTQLLLDQQMQNVENAQSAMGTNGSADFGKIMSGAQDQQKQTDEAIKSLLGEQYPYYEDYKKTMGERVQLEQLKTQLDGTKAALKDTQIRDLLYVIADEREKTPPVISQDPEAAVENFQKSLSADALEKQMQWQEEINKRILERAGSILSPEQIKSYSEYQAQQLEMQKFGMKMAREMFGKKSGIP